jgi:hypothetical protein
VCKLGAMKFRNLEQIQIRFENDPVHFKVNEAIVGNINAHH